MSALRCSSPAPCAPQRGGNSVPLFQVSPWPPSIRVVLGLLVFCLAAASPFYLSKKSIILPQVPHPHHYSTHRCIGPQNSIEGFRTRACLFSNLCYADGHFKYYIRRRVPILFDKRRGTLYNFSLNKLFPFASLYAHTHEKAPFAPEIVLGQIPQDALTYKGSFFLWRHWSNTANIGHLLWEELGAIYYTQRRFRFVSPSIQILHDQRVPTSRDFQRILSAIVPVISDRPMRALKDVVVGQSAVCFEQFFVGGGVPLFQLPDEPLLEGREEYLMDFRDMILNSFKVVPYLPSQPIILITHKTHSIYALKSKRHRVIANAVELSSFLQRSFPMATVELVEWHRLSITAQLEKVAHASILITPCGGVSMVIPLLPAGAHAIIMDYLSDGKNENTFGYREGESASMEISFWNRFPHVTKYYYQVFSQDDLEWDFPGATDMRNDASVKVNFTRMYDLVAAALSTMSYGDPS